MPLIPALATQKQMDLWEFEVGLVSSDTLRVLHKRETLSLKKKGGGRKKKGEERKGGERRGRRGKERGKGSGSQSISFSTNLRAILMSPILKCSHSLRLGILPLHLFSGSGVHPQSFPTLVPITYLTCYVIFPY